MAFGYLLVALLAASVAIFALQNTDPISVRFLFWSTQALPAAGVTLAALAIGLIVAGVPLAIARRRWRSRTRALESRVTTLESALGERDRAWSAPFTRWATDSQGRGARAAQANGPPETRRADQ